MGRIGGLLREEMPREKLIRFGPETLTNVELLAILLRTGTKEKNVLELSREILKSFDTKHISKASLNELLKFKGISIAKATQIISIFELGKRLNPKHQIKQKKVQFRNSLDIYNYIKQDFYHEQNEKIQIIYLNTKNQPIKKEIISQGGINQANLNIKLTLQKILQNNANSIILIHNHPTGDSTPSSQDIEITKKLNLACKQIETKLLDHIIIGEYYTSLFDKNLF